MQRIPFVILIISMLILMIIIHNYVKLKAPVECIDWQVERRNTT